VRAIRPGSDRNDNRVIECALKARSDTIVTDDTSSVRRKRKIVS
jgi:predicted nucleic acid-binding protein